MSDRINNDANPSENRLGTYLRNCRLRLEPAALGFPAGRRRTAGLRREEVAQRAGISPTWYTWLEQGRGGAPSALVLESLAAALMLTDVEREHLFLIGLGRPAEIRYHKMDGVTPRLQRVLDALQPCPAYIRTAIWDVVAWNQAATAMILDFGTLPVAQRNILRAMFLEPHLRDGQQDWVNTARFLVSAFRIDAARAGAATEVEPLVEELCRLSPEFRVLWENNDVVAPGEGIKHVEHPVLGPLAIEYSVFAVDGRQDLSMVVFNPIENPEIFAAHASMATTS